MENIREVRKSDAEAITSILNHYIEHTTAIFVTEPCTVEEMRQTIECMAGKFPFFVYEEAGCVIGYCYAHPWKAKPAYSPTLETTIYLSPEHLHRGIGTALMHRLIESCRGAGYHSLIACITAENMESIEFHLRLGFDIVSNFTEVGLKFGRYLDVTDMQLML